MTTGADTTLSSPDDHAFFETAGGARPHVTVKLAMSLDGRLARREGRVPRADRDVRLQAMEPVLSGAIPVVVQANDVAAIRAAMDC